MRLLDEQYLKTPFWGVRKMTWWLGQPAQGWLVNEKRVRRLLRTMGLEAIYPKPRLSVPAPGHRIYPYLLRDVVIERPDQCWASDITYVGLRGGFAYLVAVMDWYSRYVLSWEVSTSLEAAFCVSAMEWALRHGKPEISNTDQGAQFTSAAFTQTLQEHGVRISMDGRGRALDNVFIERLWRTVKYDDIFLNDYADVGELIAGLKKYFRLYNHERPHQSLGNRTPAEVYFQTSRMSSMP
jgi:putative transposase